MLRLALGVALLQAGAAQTDTDSPRRLQAGGSKGLNVEAFEKKAGSLRSWGDPELKVYGRMRSIGKLQPLAKDLWYSNDKDFTSSIGNLTRTDNYVVRFSGEYYAGRTGRHLFRASSNDGSRLYIDSSLVVDNDGDTRSTRTRIGSVSNLAKGWHKILIVFYEATGSATLQVSVAPPSSGWRKLSASMTRPTAILRSPPPPPPTPPKLSDFDLPPIIGYTSFEESKVVALNVTCTGALCEPTFTPRVRAWCLRL